MIRSQHTAVLTVAIWAIAGSSLLAGDALNEGDLLVLPKGQEVKADNFRVIGTGSGAAQATSVAVQRTDSGLDVVFDVRDANIVAAQEGRDNIKLWKDDSVYLWLDPGHTHDTGTFVMVQVTAKGVVHDARGMGGIGYDVAEMVVETSRTEGGWRAHLVLPWKGLGVEPPGDGGAWGVNFSRMDQPQAEQSAWALNDGNLVNMDRWGHFAFAGAKPASAARAAQKSMAARHSKITARLEEAARAEALRVKGEQARLAEQWGRPANPNASENTRKVLKYLAGLTDRKDKRFLLAQDIWCYDTINGKSGMDAGFDRFIKALHEKTGKWLPMVHVSYGDATKPAEMGPGSEFPANRFARQYWQAGGLVTVHSNPKNPWTGKSNTDLTGREKLPNLIKAGTPENLVWMKQLDAYAALLAELRDAGVVVLWRPLHEMTFNKCYFYDCGAYPGKPEVFKELWRHMFRYFTEEKGLDNLLWVYSVADVEWWGGPGADSVYPGGDFVDIVGISLYSDKVEVGGKAYEKLTALGKPFAFSEFGPGHDNKELKSSGKFDNERLIQAVRERYPKTIYAAYWHSWTGANMSIIDNPHAVELMNDPWVVTREELDWKSVKLRRR